MTRILYLLVLLSTPSLACFGGGGGGCCSTPGCGNPCGGGIGGIPSGPVSSGGYVGSGGYGGLGGGGGGVFGGGPGGGGVFGGGPSIPSSSYGAAPSLGSPSIPQALSPVAVPASNGANVGYSSGTTGFATNPSAQVTGQVGQVGVAPVQVNQGPIASAPSQSLSYNQGSAAPVATNTNTQSQGSESYSSNGDLRTVISEPSQGATNTDYDIEYADEEKATQGTQAPAGSSYADTEEVGDTPASLPAETSSYGSGSRESAPASPPPFGSVPPAETKAEAAMVGASYQAPPRPASHQVEQVAEETEEHEQPRLNYQASNNVNTASQYVPPVAEQDHVEAPVPGDDYNEEEDGPQEPEEPAQQAEPAQPAEAAEPEGPSEPTETAETEEAQEPAQPVEIPEPAEHRTIYPATPAPHAQLPSEPEDEESEPAGNFATNLGDQIEAAEIGQTGAAPTGSNYATDEEHHGAQQVPVNPEEQSEVPTDISSAGNHVQAPQTFTEEQLGSNDEEQDHGDVGAEEVPATNHNNVAPASAGQDADDRHGTGPTYSQDDLGGFEPTESGSGGQTIQVGASSNNFQPTSHDSQPNEQDTAAPSGNVNNLDDNQPAQEGDNGQNHVVVSPTNLAPVGESDHISSQSLPPSHQPDEDEANQFTNIAPEAPAGGSIMSGTETNADNDNYPEDEVNLSVDHPDNEPDLAPLAPPQAQIFVKTQSPTVLTTPPTPAPQIEEHTVPPVEPYRNENIGEIITAHEQQIVPAQGYRPPSNLPTTVVDNTDGYNKIIRATKARIYGAKTKHEYKPVPHFFVIRK